VVGLALGVLAAGCGRAPPPAHPDLVLITIDTIRADHLGAYGYPRPTSPNIDRFARDALLFERAVAPMPTTLPSHVSILTGTHPVRHGIVSNHRFLGQTVTTHEGLRTAAQMLRQASYATAAFTSSSPLSEPTGIGQGFDRFHGPPEWAVELRRIDVPAQTTVDAVLAWLDSAPSPFFLWVHLFDPHHPYDPPPGFGERFRAPPERADELLRRGFPEERLKKVMRLLPAYDGEIRYADREVGRLLRRLRQLDLYERSAIVLVGDHGEGLWQHGEKRHDAPWNEVILVPLIIRLPDGPKGRVKRMASLIDVLPTLAAHTNLPLDASQFDGLDLLEDTREFALAQRAVTSPNKGLVFTLSSVEWKYWHFADESDRLYHLATDPLEMQNVIEEHPDVAEAMRREIARTVEANRQRSSLPVNTQIPERVRRQLEALGYAE
jgi:arylsulfatase A-like enzyme